MYVRQMAVPKNTEPKFSPPPEIKGEQTVLTPSGKYNVIIYNWKFTHDLEDVYPQLYIENRAIRNSPNYITTASYKLSNGNFLTLTSKNIVNVIGIYHYSRVLSYCYQESNTKTRVDLILSLLTEETKTRNIYCQTKIEKIGSGYRDMTKSKQRRKIVPYAKISLSSFGMQGLTTPDAEAARLTTTTTTVPEQQQPSTSTTNRLEEANMEIVQVTDRNTEVIGKVSADGSNVEEVFTNSCFNSITIYDGTVISIPYKPEDIFHITAPEIMKFVTKQEQKKLILHQAFIDYQYCLQTDHDGLLLIHLAILNDDMDLLKRQCVVLKARGHTVDILAHNMTPLQMALTLEKREEFAKFLIDRGADLLANRDGRTALHIIAEKSGDDAALASYAMEYLLKNVRTVLEENRKLWCDNMREKTGDELKQHLQLQIGKMFDRQGYNPLMLATRRNNHKVMEVFLQLCPEIIDIQTPNYGKTALSLAIQEAIISQIMYKTFGRHIKVLQILISYNANPLITTINGETVFDQLMGAHQNHILEPLKAFISTEMSMQHPSKEIGIYEVVDGKFNFSPVKKINPRDNQNVVTNNTTGKIENVVTLCNEEKTDINEGNEIDLECNEVMELEEDEGIENNGMEASKSKDDTNRMDSSNSESGVDTKNIEVKKNSSSKLVDESSQKLKLKPIADLKEANASNSDTNKVTVIKMANETVKIIPFHKMHAEKLVAEHKKQRKRKVKVFLQEMKTMPGDKKIKLAVQKMDKNGAMSDFTIEAPAKSVVGLNTTKTTKTASGKKMTNVYLKQEQRPKIVQTFSLKDKTMKGIKVSNVTANTTATPNISTTGNIPATVRSAATLNIATTPNLVVTANTPVTPKILAPVKIPVTLKSTVTPNVLALRNIPVTVRSGATANFPATVINTAAANNPAIPKIVTIAKAGATVKTMAILNTPTPLNPDLSTSHAKTNIKVRGKPEERKKNVIVTLPNKDKLELSIELPNELQNKKAEPTNASPKKRFQKIVVPKKIITLKKVMINRKFKIVKKKKETLQNPDEIPFIDLSNEPDKSVETKNTEKATENHETQQKDQNPFSLKNMGEINIKDVNKIGENENVSTIKPGTKYVKIKENEIENSDEMNKLTYNIDANKDRNNLKPIESKETENEGNSQEYLKIIHDIQEKEQQNSGVKDIVDDFEEENIENNVQDELVTVIQILNTDLEETGKDQTNNSSIPKLVDKLGSNLSSEGPKHETDITKVMTNEIENTNYDSLDQTVSNSESSVLVSESINGSLLEKIPRKIKPIGKKRFKVKKRPTTSNSDKNKKLKEKILLKKHNIKQSKIVLEKLTDEIVEKLLSNPSEEVNKKKRKVPDDEKDETNKKTLTKSKVKILSIEVIKQGDETQN